MIKIQIDFIEWKKINDAIENVSDVYEIKSFKPWQSDGGRQYITIQLIKKE